MIVPTLCVGMPPGTLRVPTHVTQSVTGCIPTRSVGTISSVGYMMCFSGSGMWLAPNMAGSNPLRKSPPLGC